jgi:exoribonuclease R
VYGLRDDHFVKGRLTGYKFYEAVMSSHARLTYTKVWHMLQGDQDLREQYAPLVKHIEELHNLYKVLDQRAKSAAVSRLRAKKRNLSSTPNAALSVSSRLSVTMRIS